MDISESSESMQQLAAVLFSDIVGYTSIMGSDFREAMKIVADAKALHTELADKYDGDIIKQLGDGFLVKFSSAHNAASFAVELLINTQSREYDLRVGLHMGEIIMSGGDIYGDGVNLASRLQSKAQVGQILVSEGFYNNIKNDKQFATDIHGEFYLKNISEKVRAYELGAEQLKMHAHPHRFTRYRSVFFGLVGLVLVILAVTNYEKAVAIFFNNNDDLSIAILPFKALGMNADQQYFTEGIENEIRSKLVSIKGFTVRSPHTTRSHSDHGLSIREIGSRLEVTHVLEGTVQVFDDNIHFNLFLTDVKTEESTPIDLQDYPISDLYVAQSSIAMQVVLNLSLQITSEEVERVNRMPTVNLEAHQAYLLGRYSLERGTRKDYLLEAMKYFENAIEFDPDYAEAYIGLAEAFLTYHRVGYMLRDSALSKAKILLEKVVMIDPESNQLHYARGLYHFFANDPSEAMQELDAAIRIDSEDYRVHYAKWLIYYIYDDFKKGIKELEIAHKLNPISGNIKSEYTVMKAVDDDNLSELEIYVNDNHEESYTQWLLGQQYAIKGEYSKALHYLTNRGVDSLGMNFLIGYAHALNGNRKGALKVAEYLEKKYEETYLPPSTIGLIYAGLQDEDSKREWMREAHLVKDFFPSYVPTFDPYRNESWYLDWFDPGTLANPRNPWNDQELDTNL